MLNKNYQVVKKEIERFNQEFLEGNSEVLEVLDGLKNYNPQKIENAKNLNLLSSAIVYIYLKENNLNGRGGISAKKVGEFFGVKSTALTAKATELEYYCKKPTQLLEEDEIYEFYDEANRYEVSQMYWDFLESEESDDIKKSIKILKDIIKKDNYFFDPYITLSEYYVADKEYQKAANILVKGYHKVNELVLNGLRFPDVLEWGYMENRHIIRMYFHFALYSWEVDNKKTALNILQKLLKSNPNDNIGARYAIVAILEGFKSMQEFEEKFDTGFGLDATKVDEWFENASKKHKDTIGWWFKAVGEEL